MTPAIPTLTVFCRRPAPGRGKTRLAATLGTDAAARCAELLLACALEDAGAWPGPVVLAPASRDDAAWAADLAPRPGVRVVPQPEGNLGQRLAVVDGQLRAAGDRAIAYIGSDAPALDPPFYAAARDALAEADAVLGPALDGGVTLMAARRPWPRLDDLPWSESGLGAALGARCRAAGWRVAELEPRYDIDVVADLERLRSDLGADRRPARRALAAWLAALTPDDRR